MQSYQFFPDYRYLCPFFYERALQTRIKVASDSRELSNVGAAPVPARTPLPSGWEALSSGWEALSSGWEALSSGWEALSSGWEASPAIPFGWICNPAVLNIRIFNSDLAPFIALQMLIFNAVGLQIRLNGFVSVLLLQSLEASPTTMRQIRKPFPIEG